MALPVLKTRTKAPNYSYFSREREGKGEAIGMLLRRSRSHTDGNPAYE
jgi:hypothetical protein